MSNAGTEVLTINVRITGVNEVKGHTGTARMILFDGTVDCDNFKGKILPGGVDTQKELGDEPTLLSARYILEGTDKEGNPSHIFIENNGQFREGGENTTTPKVITDSQALAFLETADLYGTIEGIEGGVRIHIFEG
ncbi:DUF3237 family protein [Butyrivibrio sp. WCD3002]|uniref:DUF3237 family protein n=1 Tax=Butyrivibrio sp. WCD3002 TaxID=1280676 RepID=UPI0003FEDCEE|nr:DUF3237 family protein [Butyrivibrio sp. WCD3002]